MNLVAFYGKERYKFLRLRRIFFYQILFRAAFPAAIPFNYSSLKRDSLEFRNLKGYIPGSSGEIVAIMTAPVALALFITPVPGHPGQLL